MPLISPPPGGGGGYAGVPAIGATDHGAQGLQFVLDQATDKTVYAVCNGAVRWLPAGQPLPSGTVAKVAGVQLAVAADMVKELVERQPDGLPPLTNFVYQGLDPASFRAVVAAKVALLPEAVLDTNWRETHASDPAQQALAAKEASFVTNVLAGTATVEVLGGDALGQVQADANNASAYPLQFSAYEGERVADPAQPGHQLDQVVAASPLYFIRYLPEITQSAVWLDHPLLAATSGFTRGAKFYIGFQVSDITTGPRDRSKIIGRDGPYVIDLAYASYMGVEAGSQVHLYDHHAPGTPVATALTNGNGIAYFELTPAQVTGTADYYFVIEAPTTALVALGQTQPLQLPATWPTALDSTHYWLAANGRTKGYLANFKGFQLGNNVVPVWFNIGIDYLFDFSYEMPRPELNSDPLYLISTLPKDLTVTLTNGTTVHANNKVDELSRIYGVNFDFKLGDEFWFEIPMVLENPAIGMQQTRVIYKTQILADEVLHEDPLTDPLHTQVWSSKEDATAPIVLTLGYTTSLRNAQLPNLTAGSIRIHQDEASGSGSLRAVNALAVLSYSRELAVFLHYMTAGEYTGNYLNLKLFHLATSAWMSPLMVTQVLDKTPLSFPLHSIYLSEAEGERGRNLVVHESSHQVMYKLSAFSAGDILKRFAHQVYDSGATHQASLLSSKFLALTEGWAEAFAGIMCGYPLDRCFPRSRVYIPLSEPLGVISPGEPDVVNKKNKKPVALADGFDAPDARNRWSPWPDELTWLRNNSLDLLAHWYTLDPEPLGTQPATRLNRGEESEGAMAILLYTLFWEFVVGPAIHSEYINYIHRDNSGAPTRSNPWMSAANQQAISRRFKAFFWKPLQDLAQEATWETKTSERFLSRLAEHVSALPASDANWSAVRARLLLWNTGFPHAGETLSQFAWPTFRSTPADVRTGPRSGGNAVTYAGQGFVEAYTHYRTRMKIPETDPQAIVSSLDFRSVYMKVYINGQEATNLVVTSATQLTCTVPAAAKAGPARVMLRLWVRNILVWEHYTENHYVYT